MKILMQFWKGGEPPSHKNVWFFFSGNLLGKLPLLNHDFLVTSALRS